MGRGVAIVELGAPYRAALAVGSPSSDISGVTLAGGARLFTFGPQGVVAAPLAGFGGEATRPGGRLGERLAGGFVAGRPMLVVTGYDGTSVSLDSGSTYAFDISLP